MLNGEWAQCLGNTPERDLGSPEACIIWQVGMVLKSQQYWEDD